MFIPLTLYKNIFFYLCLLMGGALLAAPVEKRLSDSLPTRLRYSSALASYQGYTDQTVQSWHEANDRVGLLGGWRAYAKEVVTEQSAPDATLAINPHTSHYKEGKQ